MKSEAPLYRAHHETSLLFLGRLLVPYPRPGLSIHTPAHVWVYVLPSGAFRGRGSRIGRGRQVGVFLRLSDRQVVASTTGSRASGVAHLGHRHSLLKVGLGPIAIRIVIVVAIAIAIDIDFATILAYSLLLIISVASEVHMR